MGRAAVTFFQADHIVCQQLLTKYSVALEIDGTFESFQIVFLFFVTPAPFFYGQPEPLCLICQYNI